MNFATVLPAGLDLSLSGLFRRRAAVLPAPAAPERGVPHRLAKGTTLAVRRPLGCTVECEQGSLWLTFDGESEDIVLDAGQRHLANRPSRMLVHALGDSELRLSAAVGTR